MDALTDPLSGMPQFRCPNPVCNRLTSQGCHIISCAARPRVHQNYLNSGRLKPFPPLGNRFLKRYSMVLYGCVNGKYPTGIPISHVMSSPDKPSIDAWEFIIRSDVDSFINVTPGYDEIIAACSDVPIDSLEELAWLDTIPN